MGKPKIRFKGYTEDWEQRKLDDIAEFSKGSGYSKGDLTESGTPIILYGRLYTKYETSISAVDTYVEAKEGSVYSKGGEVIVPASGETAEDIARAATVDKSGVLLGGDLNIVMPNEDSNSAFLAISISNGNSQRELAKKAQGKSVVHIHNEEIRNLIVPFPTKTEQNKIVDYFSSLDHLITLHQRKCEETKKLKKYMLQKMFPQNGKSVPEIRFAGFTDAWEQRKFSELVTIERGGSPRPIDKFITNDENGLNWIKIGDAPEHGNYITQTAEKIRPEGLSKTREVHPGDLILSNSMSFGRPYIMAIDGCIHDGWLAIRDTEKNFDLKFLCILLGTDGMLNQYKAMAAGSTVNNLNKELVGGTTVAFPMMEEQIKIGEYFSNLDHLITLHQRKCDELKNMKKYMLQNMFI